MSDLILVFSTVAAFLLVFPALPVGAAMPSIFEAALELGGRDGVPDRRVGAGSRNTPEEPQSEEVLEDVFIEVRR